MDITDRFKTDLAVVSWRDLRIHMRRDAVIVVASELDLIHVATAVAGDDRGQVAAWIDSGVLSKPTAGQLQQWEEDLTRPFRMLIVQPYLLVQEDLP